MRKAMKSSCPPGAELQAFGSQAARRLNPKKLLLSKWTAASPDGKEKHQVWHCDAGDPAQWICIGYAEAPRQRCFRQHLPAPGLCAYQQLRQLAGHRQPVAVAIHRHTRAGHGNVARHAENLPRGKSGAQRRSCAGSDLHHAGWIQRPGRFQNRRAEAAHRVSITVVVRFVRLGQKPLPNAGIHNSLRAAEPALMALYSKQASNPAFFTEWAI